jgi:hypothetical protein
MLLSIFVTIGDNKQAAYYQQAKADHDLNASEP